MEGFTHPSDYPLSARRDIERLQAEIENLKARLPKQDPPPPEIPDEIYFNVDWEDGWEGQDEQEESTTP